MFVPLLTAIALVSCGWWIGCRMGKATPSSSRAPASAETRERNALPSTLTSPPPRNLRDAPQQLVQILAAATPQLRRHQLYLVAKQLSSDDFPALLSLLRKAEGKDSEKLYEDLAAFWFERDLSAAREWLASLSAPEREKLFAAVLPTWGKIDPTNVFAWLGKLSKEDQTRLASANRNRLSGLLAMSDPAAAADFLLNTPDTENEWPKGEWAVFNEWGKSDPQAASRLIHEIPLERRARAATGLIESWAELNPSEAEAWIATLDDAPLLRETSKAYVSQRAQRNPAAAAAYMLQNWIPQFQEDGQLSSVLSHWGGQDDAAALAWVKTLPDQELREQALYDLLRSIGYARPQRAVELWMSEFGDGNGSGWSSARYIAGNLAEESGFNAAADFLAKVPAKDRALTIEQFFRAEVKRTGAMDLAQAVLQRPRGSERKELIHPAFQRLSAEGQLAEARPLLESIPPGPERQAAISGLIAGELGRDPDGAFRLAQSLAGAVDGPRLASAELMRVYEPHKSQLKQWIQKTPLLSPEDKERILDRSKHNGN